MKNIVNIVCIVMALAGAFLGFRAFAEWQELSRKAVILEERIRVESEKEQQLSKFKTLPPETLEKVYDTFLNDMGNIARAYGLVCSIGSGADPLFEPSALYGLREARIRIVFSRLSGRGALVSLLAVLDESALKLPFLTEKLVQEKDTLAADVVVFGI